MKVAILGFDVEGKTSYDYYRSLGAEVTICDQKEDLETPPGAPTQLGDGYLDGLDRFDIVVRTAGLITEKVLAVNPPSIVQKMTTQINEFLRVCPTKNIIGITGTKGKGTTSTLVNKMLQAAGRETYLGGNIGIAPFTFLDKLTADSWVVLELSSFQLSDVQYSPHIGVCLMVAPEHLNWHRDMEDYMQAKSRLFAQQSSGDIAIYFAESATSHEIAEAGAGRKLPFYRSPGAFVNGNMITIDGQEICTTDELKLLGKHNWQNVCAALTAVWQAGVHDIDAIRSVLTTFAGLEYRLEFVRELDGVKYYNDSFGTTPETAIVALEAFAQPKVAILGGSDKGITFEHLAEAVTRNNVRQVVLIGNTTNPDHTAIAPNIEADLHKKGFTAITNLAKPGGTPMAEIVRTAREAAQPGDVVVFSTGSASFDMFSNYKDRGNQFKAAVNALA